MTANIPTGHMSFFDKLPLGVLRPEPDGMDQLQEAAKFFTFFDVFSRKIHKMNLALLHSIHREKLSGTISINDAVNNANIDPVSFLWVMLYYIACDFYQDAQANFTLHDFLEKEVMPHFDSLPMDQQNTLRIFSTGFSTQPPSGTRPSVYVPPATMSVTSPLTAPGADEFREHAGIGYTYEPRVLPGIQMPTTSRVFGQRPQAGRPFPMPPLFPVNQGRTSTGLSSGGSKARAEASPAEDPAPDTPIHEPTMEENLSELQSLLDTPTGCTGSEELAAREAVSDPQVNTHFSLPFSMNVTSTPVSLHNVISAQPTIPPLPVTQVATATTQPVNVGIPFAAYPSLAEVLNMLANQLRINQPQPSTIVQPTTVVISQTQLPKFKGTLTSEIPDLTSWMRKIILRSQANKTTLLHELEFHVEGEPVHLVEQMHRQQILSDNQVLSTFVQHYGYLQKSHTKAHFNKLFNGSPPVRWTKNMRMNEYINKFRNEIADAAIPLSDLAPGTSSSRILCQRFRAGLSTVLQKDLKQDPQNNYEEFNDLQRMYAAALKAFDKHEMNPKLYLNEAEPKSSDKHHKRRERDDEDDSPAPKKHKYGKQPHQKQHKHKHKHNSSKLYSSQGKSKSNNLRPGAKPFTPTSTLPPLLQRAKEAYEAELDMKADPMYKSKGAKPIYDGHYGHDSPLPVNPNRSNYRGEIHPGWLKHAYGSARVNKLYGKCVACMVPFHDLAKDTEPMSETMQNHWQSCSRMQH